MRKLLLKNPEKLLDRYPHQLSGGMRQRLLAVISLSFESEVLIADEPTKGLDPETKARAIDIFTRIKIEYKKTMILIIHDLDLALEVCDRVAVMEWEGIFGKLEEGNWDVLLSTMGVSNVADPRYVFNDIYLAGADGNRGDYSNSTLDAMIIEAKGIANHIERYEKFDEIQAFVHEEQPIIPVCYYSCAVAKKD